jgi:hypothetical protein
VNWLAISRVEAFDAAIIRSKGSFGGNSLVERSQSDMSSRIQNYSLVTLNDRVVPGFAGIMRESIRAKESLPDRELKVVGMANFLSRRTRP